MEELRLEDRSRAHTCVLSMSGEQIPEMAVQLRAVTPQQKIDRYCLAEFAEDLDVVVVDEAAVHEELILTVDLYGAENTASHGPAIKPTARTELKTLFKKRAACPVPRWREAVRVRRSAAARPAGTNLQPLLHSVWRTMT